MLKKILFPILLFCAIYFVGSLIVQTFFIEEDPVIAYVTDEDWNTLQVSLNDYPLTNEEFEVEIDKTGRVVAVHSQQKPIVDHIKEIQFITPVDSEGEATDVKMKLNYKDRFMSGLRMLN